MKNRRKQRQKQRRQIQKKPRWKRHHLRDEQVNRILKTVETAFRMAEQGLRPMPLEIENPLEAGTFTGETWETSWHFADHLLFLSTGIEGIGEQPRFDILLNEYELATALVDIPIIAHLNLQVTPVDTLPSDDSRYDNAPRDVPLWRVHSPDFQECHPGELYVMHLLTEEEEAEDGKQDAPEK